MRGVSLFMVIVALPALAALGFDCYLYYMHPEAGFMLSTPGYIWTHYHPDSYKWTVENTDAQTWAIIDLILAEKTVTIAIAFAGFFYIIIGIMRLLRLGRFRDTSRVYSGTSRVDELMNRSKTTQYKYKRK